MKFCLDPGKHVLLLLLFTFL